MQIRSVLILVVAACAIQQISAFNCACHGTDVCNCKKTVNAPRPYPVHVPTLHVPALKSICKEHSWPSAPQPFKPIGDACHCGQQIVKPAPQQRRPCPLSSLPSIKLPTCSCKHTHQHNNIIHAHFESKGCDQHTHHENQGCGHAIRAPEKYQNYNNDDSAIYFETKTKHATQHHSHSKSGPADVVSIQISKRLANAAKNGVSERQLQYGSLKEPTVNIKSNKKPSNFHEESFYDTKGHVLELKSHLFKPHKQVSSESDSSEEAKKKPAHDAFNIGYLKFDDLGYKAYEQSNPRYSVVTNSEPAKHACNKNRQTRPCKKHSGGQCDCYKHLVIDQHAHSAHSDQSMSYESGHHFTT